MLRHYFVASCNPKQYFLGSVGDSDATHVSKLSYVSSGLSCGDVELIRKWIRKSERSRMYKKMVKGMGKKIVETYSVQGNLRQDGVNINSTPCRDKNVFPCTTC